MKAVLWMPKCKYQVGFTTKASCMKFCKLGCKSMCKEKDKTPIKLGEVVNVSIDNGKK